MTQAPLHVETGGAGQGLLIMLHGLGATGAVWQRFVQTIEGRWPGRWLLVDLPGHGASAPATDGYDIGMVTAMLGSTLRRHTRAGEQPVILGHSYGGALGLALATGWYGVAPMQVYAVGIKCAWSESDLFRMAQLATQPAKQFADEAAAWDRYLKVSGLYGLVEPGSALLARGVAAQDTIWRLAMDPAANGCGRPPLAELLNASRCPLYLARGGQDTLVTLQQLSALHTSAHDLGAHGHNIMVEAPEALWNWLAARLRN